ncbi:hypothetical protein [Phaffia rhodozyma]|uniref:Uncharacterized protein n=1 Tax=Phaffia rhodozyma TaxID=264483 RepID=A0A0F7SWG5_PHARH|nr:hypothetical protein [Phaffia rhodozyma]
MSTLRKPEELFEWLTVDLAFPASQTLKLSQFTRLCRGSLHLLLHLLSLHLLGIVPTLRTRSELHRFQALSISNQLPGPTRSLLFPSESSYATCHRTHAHMLRLCDKLAKAQKELNSILALTQDGERSRDQEKERGVRQSGRLKVLEETKIGWIETWERLEKLRGMDAAESGTTSLDHIILQKVLDQLTRFVDSATKSKSRATQYPTSLDIFNIRDLFEPLKEWITKINHRRERAERQDTKGGDNTLEMDHLSDTLFDLHRLHIELAGRSFSKTQSSAKLSSDMEPERPAEDFVGHNQRNYRLKWEEKLRRRLEDRYNGDQDKVQEKMKSVLQKVQQRTDIAFEKQINQTSIEAIMNNRSIDAVKLNNLKKVWKGREERKLYLDALDVQWRKITRDVYSLLQVHERLVQSISQHTQSIDKTCIVRDNVLDAIRSSIVGLEVELENQVSQTCQKEDATSGHPNARTKNGLQEEVFGKLAELTFEGKVLVMERALRERAALTKMIDALGHFREALTAAEKFVDTNTLLNTENSQSMKWKSQLDKLHDALSQRSLDIQEAGKEFSVYKHEMDALMTGKIGQRGKKLG